MNAIFEQSMLQFRISTVEQIMCNVSNDLNSGTHHVLSFECVINGKWQVFINCVVICFINKSNHFQMKNKTQNELDLYML